MNWSVVSVNARRGSSEHGAARADQRIRLRDGRWLGFAEYGDPRGIPLFAS